MPKRLTIQEFIERAQKVHGDQYDYSKVEFVDVLTKVTIICKKHGDFMQTPRSHYQGKGCPTCAKVLMGKARTVSFDDFLKKAREIHGYKYSYDKSSYVNMTTLTKITCPIHGDFLQLPSHHVLGNGCQKCAKESISTKKKNLI